MITPKVLIVAPRLDIGGTEMHLARIVPQLRERGVGVSLYVIERGGALEHCLLDAGVPVAGLTRTLPRPFHAVRALVDLLIQLRRQRPDLLHFFLPRPYLIGTIAAAILGHDRRIMSRRSLTNYMFGHPILRRLERFAHRSTLAFLANSNAVAGELRLEVSDPDQVGLIHNGVVLHPPVTPEKRAVMREQLDLPQDAFVIAIVASLISYKGHSDLVAALSVVKDDLPKPWRLLVIGRDEGLGAGLAHQATSQGIEDEILWLGERSDVDAVLECVDLAVLASHQEGFSNSLLETLGKGIPTIATAVGGNLDAIDDGESGLLVPPHRPDLMGEAIRSLAGDSAQRERLGVAARQRVRELFSLDVCVDRYENLYRNQHRLGQEPVQPLVMTPAAPLSVYAPPVLKRPLGSAPRVAYASHTMDLEAPGDRRRFVAYARARDLVFEHANPREKYDLVVLSESADISVWPDYTDGKLVYDLIDSYLSVPRTNPAQLLRGTAWYILRKHERFRPDYLTSIRAMCRRSDAVVCASHEQRLEIEKLCSNVHIILDSHATVVKSIKTDYSAGRPFRLVWEGLPSNLPQLIQAMPFLQRLRKEIDFELHVVTDPSRERLKGLLGTIDSRRFLAQNLPGINAAFHEWHEATCADIITACDLALIPIDLDDPFVRGKPENKLLLLWRMGMPAVVSATPAYARAMTEVGTSALACESEGRWLAVLTQMALNESARAEAARRGRVHAETFHGSEAVMGRWDAMFRSIGLDFNPTDSSKAAE